MKAFLLALLTAVCALATAPRSAAHDFWIEVSDYSPAPGQPVKVFLKSGHAPTGESISRLENAMERFVLLSSEGSSPIPGVAGQNPAGYLRKVPPGNLVVAYESQLRSIALPPEKFAEHATHEGLDIALASPGKSKDRIREAYTKYAKCILRTAHTEASTPLPVAGHRFEIVPEQNPSAPGFAGTLSGKVLFEGDGAAGLLITAESRDARQSVESRTGPGGKFRLELPNPGTWVINCVRIEAAKSPEYDWQSQWASLVFRF